MSITDLTAASDAEFRARVDRFQAGRPVSGAELFLDELDAAREKATPWPWAQHESDPAYVIGSVSDDGEEYLDVADAAGSGRPGGWREAEADAALIVAAVNALPKLTAALRAVSAEHVPLMNTNPRQPACPECLGGIYADDPDEPRSCGCWGLSTPVCSSCADHHAIRPFVLQWPCPTVKAIAAIAALASP